MHRGLFLSLLHILTVAIGLAITVEPCSADTPDSSATPVLTSLPSSALWAAMDSAATAVVDSTDITETYMRPLAKAKRSSRMLNGILGLGVGAYFSVRGMDILNHEEEYENGKAAGTAHMTYGILMGILGIADLATPSKAEKKLAELLELEDRNTRDFWASDALQKLSADARRSRITGGFAWAALGVVQLTVLKDKMDEEDKSTADVLAGLDFVAATICFMVKTREETTYNEFVRRQTGSTNLSFGPSFDGKTFGLAANLSF